jgi:hypothetical protein
MEKVLQEVPQVLWLAVLLALVPVVAGLSLVLAVALAPVLAPGLAVLSVVVLGSLLVQELELDSE